ncbi:MAG: hypothetical protein QM737_02400 [Ferruginibacter sp.]
MKDRKSIEIDLDVYKAIIHHSNYIDEPANDVLKRLLHQEQQGSKNSIEGKAGGGLTVKETFLRNGLRLQKRFKGILHEAVVRNGCIEYNNKKFTSPSGAAVSAAKGSVNGWRFWDFLDEKDNKWKILETLRK